jgi:predicted enzyme related to lactoylglutathione lyase
MTGFLDFPPAGFERGVWFWRAVTGYGISAPRGTAAEFATLVPDHGDAYLRVQRVAEGDPGCHLDLHLVDAGGMTERVVSLGARVLRSEPGLTVLTSPAGLTFCLVEHEGEAGRPPPSCWPGGQRSLVDQLCLDIPASAFDAECAFWAAVTQWEHRHGSRPELSYLTRPAGMPLRLLLQRLSREDPGPCRAHLDLACDDLALERQRHQALGAVVVRAMPNWTTLRDPTGLAYCVTRRDPAAGTLWQPATTRTLGNCFRRERRRRSPCQGGTLSGFRGFSALLPDQLICQSDPA